jgi:hypothetical protein
MDTLNGLPAHILLVHAVVVLLPWQLSCWFSRHCGPRPAATSPPPTPYFPWAQATWQGQINTAPTGGDSN